MDQREEVCGGVWNQTQCQQEEGSTSCLATVNCGKKIPLKLNDIYLVACVTENWYALSPGCLVLTPFT